MKQKGTTKGGITLKEITFSVLDSALHQQNVDPRMFVNLTQEHWNKLFQIAQEHHVEALFFRTLQQLPPQAQPPKELMGIWYAITFNTHQMFNFYSASTVQLLSFFNRNQTNSMLLGSMALSANYQHPEDRLLTSIQYYQFDQFTKADKAISQRLKVQLSTNSDHNFHYQIHNMIPVVSTHTLNGECKLKKDKKFSKWASNNIQASSTESEFDGEKVLIPSSSFLAVYFLRQMLSKFSIAKLQLQDFCDWCMLLEKHGEHIDWTELERQLSNFGMLRFAKALTHIAQSRLGLQNNHLPQWAPEKAIEQILINDTFAKQEPIEVGTGFFAKRKENSRRKKRTKMVK